MLFHNWRMGRLPNYHPSPCALWLAYKIDQPTKPKPAPETPKKSKA